MKYRTKLYLAFVVVVLTTTFLGLSLIYWVGKRALLADLRNKVLTVAATAAQTVDGDLLATIKGPEDVNKPAFGEITSMLIKMRDINRRPDIYIVWLYTLKPMAENPKQLALNLDIQEESGSAYAYTGEPFPQGVKVGLLEHLQDVWATPSLVTDHWGTFLSGYAPVYDEQGKYVATIGADIKGEYVLRELNHLRKLVVMTLLLALTVGLLAATWLSRVVTRSLDRIVDFVYQIGQGQRENLIHLETKDEFGQLANSINEMAKKLEESERLKSQFIRYVSKHILEKILSNDKPVLLTGERKQVTVIFTGIEQFARLAERLSAEEVIVLFNEYLEKMLDVVFACDGTLDKFTTEGLMVEFGAPLDDVKQEVHAVQCAIEMQKAFQILSEKWVKEGREELHMGIGIHSGIAIVGNIGSEQRMEYTAIGDTVNVAARLEESAKALHKSILISETTMAKLQGLYQVENLGSISLHGREQPIVIYSVETQ